MAKKTKSSGREQDLFRVAAFMLFDAMTFHEVLSNGHAALTPVSRAPLKGKQRFFRDTWLKIRDEINYKPVFDLAIDIIDALPASPDTELMLKKLEETAVEAVRSGILLKHDFMGRIYHKLLLSTTGHYYATYYTSLPAAWLLTGLLLRDPNPAWDFGELAFFDDFKLIDPACGSGTLLSASYSALKDQYIKHTPDEVDVELLHNVLLSRTVHGWDVLDFAAHLSLTNLALHSDTVEADQSNIYRMPLGAKKGGAVQLGSLEYLRKTIELKGIALVDPVEELDFGGRNEVELSRDKYDVVIMNPPFSRSAKPNLHFGYTEDEARKRMQRSLSEMGKALGLYKAAVAGLTPFFMELGLEMLNENGRIGLVAPRSTLSGVGSKMTRAHYEQQTHVKFVVSNFDPGSKEERVDGWSWSENTDIGEVLVVAEQNSDAANLATTYVNVFRKPRNEAEALILSQQVLRHIQRGSVELKSGRDVVISVLGKPSAAVYSVPQNELQGNWLAPATFATPSLNALVLEVLRAPSLIPIDKVLGIVNRELATGRDIAPVKQNFREHPVSSDARMIFGHQAAMRQVNLSKSNVRHAKALRGAPSKKMFKDFAATLLLSERPHLKTESLLAFKSPERVLTTAFWELQLRPEVPEEWLVLWFNSTYGILSYLSQSTSSQGDIFKLKKDQLKLLKVPAFHKKYAASLSALFQSVEGEAFRPYSAEFLRAAAGKGPRKKLDSFFGKLLSLPQISSTLYRALASDPVVSKQALS